MAEYSKKKMSILIVDDAIENLLLLETILDNENLGKVLLAESAEEAYEYIGITKSDKNTSVDLILMDLIMPKISGIKAIKEIRKYPEYIDIPIVVVSALSETSPLVEAFESGASDYLIKPVKELELIARIRSMLKLKTEIEQRKRHEKKLDNLTRELKEKNEKITQVLATICDDLKAAGKIQRSMLPSSELKISEINFSYYFEPCEDTGGDIVNIIPLNKRYVALFIIDVSGHGVQSAMSAMSIHGILSGMRGTNSILCESDGTPRPPSRIVDELNSEFMLQKDTYQYFTMILGFFDKKEHKFTYTRAGHTPLIIQGKDGKITVHNEGNIPVGLSENQKYDQFSIDTPLGTRLILYSDGITEAKSKNNNKPFGDERLYKLLENNRSVSVESAVKNIVSVHQEWMDGTPPKDDITMIITEPV